MSELIIELSRLRFNSNVRTETVADNILQEANHRFDFDVLQCMRKVKLRRMRDNETVSFFMNYETVHRREK